MLELDNVNAYYGESHILHGVSLTVREGEVVCLLGRNGAGKTSLVLALAGLRPAQGGNVELDGNPLAAYGRAELARRIAVLLGGPIGFVGLVVPHLLRLCGVHRHKALLPLAVCLGGSLLALADTLARTAAAPTELPVGVVTALIGVPVLLVLLARSR